MKKLMLALLIFSVSCANAALIDVVTPAIQSPYYAGTWCVAPALAATAFHKVFDDHSLTSPLVGALYSTGGLGVYAAVQNNLIPTGNGNLVDWSLKIAAFVAAAALSGYATERVFFSKEWTEKSEAYNAEMKKDKPDTNSSTYKEFKTLRFNSFVRGWVCSGLGLLSVWGLNQYVNPSSN